MIGETILHYKILEKIGEGGMGVVYKAEDTKLERTVAIKFLPRQITADSEERERLKIEAKAAASLNHPNIATIYAIEEVDDDTFIVMEYIKGKELRELTTDGRELSIEDVTNYATQIAEGLKAAHEEDVTHRDIKSANIMITDKGQVKIMDFGLAKVRGGTQVTKVGTTLGTAAYMSPEQARGEEANHRSDIWSFGVVLYEMLTGQMPFKGDYEQAVIYSIIHEDPPSLRDHCPEIPDGLEEVVLKALSKDEEERYQSTVEIQADLTAIQEGNALKTSIRPRTGLTGVVKKRTLAIAASIIAMVLIFSLITIFRSSGPTTVTSIAVMPFDFDGEEEWHWLGSAITELINTNLAQTNSLQVLTSRQGDQIVRSLGIENITELSKDEVQQIASEAKVKRVVLGSLQKTGNMVRAQANVFEAENGDLLSELKPVEGEPQKLNELAANLSSQLVELLDIETKANNLSTGAIQSLEAFRFFLEGKDAALDRRFPESIDKLQKAISYDSTYVSAYRWLAYSLDEAGDDVEAKKVLAKGKPYISDLSVEMRLEYLCDMAQIEGRWRDYATYLEELLQIKPLKAGYHYSYGWLQWKKFRRFEAGIAEMEKSLQLDSTYRWVYNELAFAYLSNGNQSKAFENIEQYISLNPTDVNPLDSKAQIQVLVGQYQGAISNYERVLALQPDFPDARPFLAQTYIALGQYSRALEVLNEHMRFAYSPKFKSSGQAYKARVHFLKGEFVKALELADQGLAMDSANLMAHWMRARILLRLENKSTLQDEIAALESALRELGGLDGRWLLYHLQGEIHLSEGRFKNAIDSFNKAVALKPQDRSFYLTALGKAYQEAGQIAESVETYQQALAFNPNNVWALFGTAETHEKSGRTSQAKKAYQRLLEIWSEADADLPELIDTKTKLAKLTGVSSN